MPFTDTTTLKARPHRGTDTNEERETGQGAAGNVVGLESPWVGWIDRLERLGRFTVAWAFGMLLLLFYFFVLFTKHLFMSYMYRTENYDDNERPAPPAHYSPIPTPITSPLSLANTTRGWGKAQQRYKSSLGLGILFFFQKVYFYFTYYLKYTHKGTWWQRRPKEKVGSRDEP